MPTSESNNTLPEHGGLRALECVFPEGMTSVEMEAAAAELTVYLGGRATVHTMGGEEPYQSDSRIFTVRFIPGLERSLSNVLVTVDAYLQGLAK